jgi:hypothetical protein
LKKLQKRAGRRIVFRNVSNELEMDGRGATPEDSQTRSVWSIAPNWLRPSGTMDFKARLRGHFHQQDKTSARNKPQTTGIFALFNDDDINNLGQQPRP